MSIFNACTTKTIELPALHTLGHSNRYILSLLKVNSTALGLQITKKNNYYALNQPCCENEGGRALK